MWDPRYVFFFVLVAMVTVNSVMSSSWHIVTSEWGIVKCNALVLWLCSRSWKNKSVSSFLIQRTAAETVKRRASHPFSHRRRWCSSGCDEHFHHWWYLKDTASAIWYSLSFSLFLCLFVCMFHLVRGNVLLLLITLWCVCVVFPLVTAMIVQCVLSSHYPSRCVNFMRDYGEHFSHFFCFVCLSEETSVLHVLLWAVHVPLFTDKPDCVQAVNCFAL